MMRATCILLLGAVPAPPKAEPPAEVPPLEGVRVEAIRLTVHSSAVEVLEELSLPASALDREVFVSLPLVELPAAVDVSLLDAEGREACSLLPWRRLPQQVRTTALLHGSPRESGIAFAVRGCPALEAAARVVVRVREAYVRPRGAPAFEWRRALGRAGIEPSPLRHVVARSAAGAPAIRLAEARYYVKDARDGRPSLAVEGDAERPDPAGADPSLVARTPSDRLVVRLTFVP